MARRFLTSIDLVKNEIQNVVIHKLAVAPATPVDGQIYFNTTDDLMYLRVDGVWRDITGRLNSILTNTNAVSITDNGDGTISVDVLNATGTDAGLMSPAHFTSLQGATSANTASTLVQRDASGDAAFNNLTVSNMGSTPTSVATKGYVDGLVTTGVNIVGSLDASTNPNYPAATQGDAYYISADGRVGGASGELVEQGDMIVALTTVSAGDQATVGTDWLIMQANIDMATTTVAGKVRLADAADMSALDDSSAVTPALLASYVASQAGAGKYAVSVGNGSATSIGVTHNLNTTDVQVQLYDFATKEFVETDVVVTDANTVTLTFAVAPASNAYRVIVQG